MDVYTWLYLWSIVTSLRSSLSSHCIYPQVIPQSHYFGGALRQFKNGWLQKLPLTGISQIYIYIYMCIYIYIHIYVYTVYYIYICYSYTYYTFLIYIFIHIYIYILEFLNRGNQEFLESLEFLNQSF